MHAFLDSAVIAREGGRSSNRQTIITVCPAFAGHDRSILQLRAESGQAAADLAQKNIFKKNFSQRLCRQCVRRVSIV